MVDLQLQADVSELLYREGQYLDQQRWDDWLELFTDDIEYWVPSWVSEHEQVTDPQREISLIYQPNKSRLAERSTRAASGTSAASMPLPRTCHLVSNIIVEKVEGDAVDVQSAWHVDYFHRKEVKTYFGHYQHHLVREGDALKIKRKKITLMNDFIPTVMDVYHI